MGPPQSSSEAILHTVLTIEFFRPGAASRVKITSFIPSRAFLTLKGINSAAVRLG